jgi:hypothetical protein
MAVNYTIHIFTVDRIHELYVRMQIKLCYLFRLAPAGLGPPVLLGDETGVQLRLLGLYQLGQSPRYEKKYCFIKNKTVVSFYWSSLSSHEIKSTVYLLNLRIACRPSSGYWVPVLTYPYGKENTIYRENKNVFSDEVIK